MPHTKKLFRRQKTAANRCVRKKQLKLFWSLSYSIQLLLMKSVGFSSDKLNLLGTPEKNIHGAWALTIIITFLWCMSVAEGDIRCYLRTALLEDCFASHFEQMASTRNSFLLTSQSKSQVCLMNEQAVSACKTLNAQKAYLVYFVALKITFLLFKQTRALKIQHQNADKILWC